MTRLRQLTSGGVYAPPRVIDDLGKCYFYHTMEIPGYGLVEGQWDLRDNFSEYIGGFDFDGKRVLEVGTASGFVCFNLEQRGADVVAYDLSDAQSWDNVPMASRDGGEVATDRRAIMRQINDGYWLAHRAFASKAKVVYGTVYEIPEQIGPVDVATYFSILLHLRDPFRALEAGARLTRDTMVVTDLLNPHRRGVVLPADVGPFLPMMEFVPDFHSGGPVDTWWYLTPEIVTAFLGVLGFGRSEVTRHVQKASWGDEDLFTVVAHRTHGVVVGS